MGIHNGNVRPSTRPSPHYVYVQSRNQAGSLEISLTNGSSSISVESLRRNVASAKTIDLQEVEISLAGRVLLDGQVSQVRGGSTVVLRRRPQKRGFDPCPVGVTRGPVHVQVPLSQQPESTRQFGVSVPRPNTIPAAYPEAAMQRSTARPASHIGTTALVQTLLPCGKARDEVPQPPRALSPEYICTLCSQVMKDAVIVRCCYVSFCDTCCAHAFETCGRCPSCKTPGSHAGSTLANRNLRVAIRAVSSVESPAVTPAVTPVVDPGQSERLDGDGLYRTLNVRPSATQKEITKAFHRQSLRLHPDKQVSLTCDERTATAAFQRLSAAYDVLGDARLRRQYDEKQRNQNCQRDACKRQRR